MNEKPTTEEVREQLAALKLPDATVDELLTLIREPLAHVAFRMEGGQVRVWTRDCVFVLDPATLRVSVAAAETAGIHAARRIVKTSGVDAPVAKRGRPRKAAPLPVEEPRRLPKAEDEMESLNEDKGVPQEPDDDDGSEGDGDVVVPSEN